MPLNLGSLSFNNDALQRQIAHAHEFRYAHLVEGIVSHNLLIDETWLDGERSSIMPVSFFLPKVLRPNSMPDVQQRLSRSCNQMTSLD